MQCSWEGRLFPGVRAVRNSTRDFTKYFRPVHLFEKSPCKEKLRFKSWSLEFVKPDKTPIVEHDFALPVPIEVSHAGEVAVAEVVGPAGNLSPVLGDVRGVGKVQTTLAMAIDHVGPAAVGIDQQIGTSGPGSLKLGCGVEDVELSALAWRGLT